MSDQYQKQIYKESLEENDKERERIILNVKIYIKIKCNIDELPNLIILVVNKLRTNSLWS